MTKQGYDNDIQLEEMPTGKNTEDLKSDSTSESTNSSKNVGQPVKKTSNLETMIHLLKGNIGTGIFAMPSAFKNAGLWTGVALVPIMAIICTHCMQILVNCAAVMKTRRDSFVLDYADVAEMACTTGDKRFRKYGPMFRRLINIFICITQFGFCCIYLVFISENLKAVIYFYFKLDWEVQIYMCLLTIPLIFLNWIRNLKYLAPVSLIANILQTVSIVVVFYYVLQNLPSYDTVPGFGSWGGLPLFFGTVVFTFEGIALVLPLQRDMRRPQDFRGWVGLLNVGMVIVTCLYVAVGFFGYVRYGENIEASITLNLPSSDVLAQVIKIMMVFAISGSYALQFYVPIPIIWPSLSSLLRLDKHRAKGEYGFRFFMCLIILALSALIPKIDLFISLVGAFGSSFLALIFPPILELITFWPNNSVPMIIKNVLILLFGVLGFATGTYASILAIVESFSGDSFNSTTTTEMTTSTALY